jgi:UDP-N-acetylglucosamine 2-epimerase
MKSVNNIEIVEKLEQFRHKGAAWQSQNKAQRLLRELKDLLSEDEHYKLSLAHAHYETGDNTHEIYDTCKELIEKYQKTSIKLKH